MKIPDATFRREIGSQWGPAAWEASLQRWWGSGERWESPWTVAVSGGPDSIALLLALEALSPEVPVTIVHFNHRTRGSGSEADARLVRAYADALGWPFRLGERTGDGEAISEDALRRDRLAFFTRTMAETGSRVLWTGHQLDDVLENQLMRLCRGSGSEGLAAPRPVHRHSGRTTLRPLLGFSAEAIRSLLQTAGVPFCQDPSNQEDLYWRNRLRQSVIPALVASAQHDPRQGAARTRRQMEEDALALADWAEAEWQACAGRREHSPHLFPPAETDWPSALQRRLLDRWLRAQGVSTSAASREKMLDALRSGGDLTLSLSPDCQGQIASGVCRLVFSGPEPRSFSPPGPICWQPLAGFLPWPWAGGELRGKLLTPAERETRPWFQANPDREVYLAWPEGEAVELQVRTRLPGDRFQPMGNPGSTPLKKLDGLRKVPPAERDRLPVVLSITGHPLWIPGLPPAASHQITPGSGPVLYLTYHSASPS